MVTKTNKIQMLFYAIAAFCITTEIFFLLPCANASEPLTQCAKIVSVEGRVEVQRNGSSTWISVAQNDEFCPGDTIRTKKNSRSAIALPGGIHIRIEQLSEAVYPEIKNEKTVWLEFIEGMANFFSRQPRRLKVDTPFVTATVEGTEFLIKVDQKLEQSLVLVFSGRVNTENEKGSLILNSGEAALARKGMPPVPYTVIRPRDAAQWALYYPPVIDIRPFDFDGKADWEIAIRKSIQLYQKGDICNAIEALESIAGKVSDPRFYIYRAGLYLSVGRVDEAIMNIDLVSAIDPAEALPLMSVIALVKNDKEKSLELAQKAVAGDPESAAAQIALAYAQQGNFNLDGALETQQKAVELEKENALAWARLAELWLAAGNLDKAEKAAEQAVELNPGFSRAQTVMGYAHLTQINISEAIASFEKAISQDQADPLPRLGLGLAKIRNGDLEEGRGEIEIAASLDPNNSLIRSYLGKAFHEEKRDGLAAKQFGLAKNLDPNDPTPWLYDAIHKQANNRPVEALYDLQKSIELNDNRAVYRSKMLLDQDLAARSASLARIFDDLGFQQLALAEGYKSVNTDPGNYSAHRFLADSYSVLPRHEIARVSEMLQAQLLQPININPVSPQLAEGNSYILRGTTSSEATLNEYSPLFTRNRLAIQATGMGGSNATWSDEIVQSGVWNKYSYSMGQFHYETDGFRENNDHNKDIYNVFFQTALSSKTSMMAEYLYNDDKRGDLGLHFDPDNFYEIYRENELARSMRLGFKHTLSPNSKIIVTYIKQSVKGDGNLEEKEVSSGLKIQKEMSFSLQRDGDLCEVQHIYNKQNFSLISGMGYFRSDRDSLFTGMVTLFDPFGNSLGNIPINNTQISKTDHTNIYVYSTINFPDQLIWNIGANIDLIDSDLADKDQFNPKFGITWHPTSTTTVRGAAFKTMQRSMISHQTIEPTQISGFNQFFNENVGTDSWRYGMAVEQKISNSIYSGAEYSMREGETPIFIATEDSDFPEIKNYNWDEEMIRTYLYWTPLSEFALGAEYFFEYQKTETDVPDPEEYKNIKTHRIPLGITYFNKKGFAIFKINTMYVNQHYETLQSSGTIKKEKDDFFVTNLELSYRLPKKLGVFSIIGKNIFDEKFHYQDTDPNNPRIYPGRQIFGKLTITF